MPLVFDGVHIPTSRKRKRDISSDKQDRPQRVVVEEMRGAESSSLARRPQVQRSQSLPIEDEVELHFAVWRPPPEITILTDHEELAIIGESPEDEDTILNDDDQKPVRILDKFVFFDAHRNNKLVSLDALEHTSGNIEAAGFVTACHENDEDEGQEDGLSEDLGDSEAQYVHLGAIFRYTFDYTEKDAPFWIETEWSWYILGTPAEEYKSIYSNFTAPHVLAGYILSSVSEYPEQAYDDFLTTKDFNVTQFREAIPIIRDFVEPQAPGNTFKTSPVIKGILGSPKRRGPPQRILHHQTHDTYTRKRRAKDLNPTYVTPLIASLADGLCWEKLELAGKPLVSRTVSEKTRRQKLLRRWQKLIDRAREDRQSWRINFGDTLSGGGDQESYCFSVDINGETYEPGDVVLVPIEKYGDPVDSTFPASFQLKEDDDIANHFWFASIIYILKDKGTAHIRWFDHGFQITPQQLANPQELFLHNDCGYTDLNKIIGKVPVVHIPPTKDIPISYDEYYYKFMYNHLTGAFTSVDWTPLQIASCSPPPENCPVCITKAQEEEEEKATSIDSGTVSYRGQKFHLHDFVLYCSAEEGPARIGQISKIISPKQSQSDAQHIKVELKRLGRICDLKCKLPKTEVRDERHLFMTPILQRVALANVLQICLVHPFIPIEQEDLEEWLLFSPNHFLVKHTFPSLTGPSWDDRTPISSKSVPSCKVCASGDAALYRDNRDSFKISAPAIDLFGGCGAFGLGLSNGSRSIQIIHAVEIAPSAAKTYQHNSPNTIVHNQCVNVMLKYAVKLHYGQGAEIPSQLYDSTIKVSPPPKPGDVKVVIAGFPCQSFSGLNKCKRNDDTKSNLFFNALSWIDFLNPDYAIFENVPGFLSHRLKASQNGQGKLTGGLEQGGLKFLLRALLEMGYQARYGYLQAGHYGTPQSRLRFFMVAAKHGLKLPDLPRPTHDFPRPIPPINLSVGASIKPVVFVQGTALHPSVSINDAIEDLPPFDWRDPDGKLLSTNFPAFECKKENGRCGYEGAVEYRHPPRTRFQLNARILPTTDLQHYTRILDIGDQRRAMHIPMRPTADYRDLPLWLQNFQLSNPSSANAKHSYKPGPFGRLDGNGYFPTTVTNMAPTAKQGRVLHPNSRRMVTVRELARSQGFPDNFVFLAVNDNVVAVNSSPCHFDMLF
uniref:Cytosine-specific methyltransferase n=1 Tax=Moniliophthora roreri TaxID=221103 RepID=A0A0W0FRZ2_MONRR